MDEEIKNPLDETLEVRACDSKTANLDALIDNALGTYTAGEPRTDLSARILSAAHALEPRPQPGRLLRPTRPWAFAASGWLAATAMLLVWLNLHNLQIVIQPRPVATQLALGATPTRSGFLNPAPTPFKTSPRPMHFQHAVRPFVPTPRARQSGRVSIFSPIAFEPIVIAPISSGGN